MVFIWNIRKERKERKKIISIKDLRIKIPEAE